jgi:hypothetical protein
MKFLVDAQLPRRMTAWLTAAGCDAIHTLDLPDANRTTDEQVNDIADREQRAVVTKDADFSRSHAPRLRVGTGARPVCGLDRNPPLSVRPRPRAAERPDVRSTRSARSVGTRT